MVFVPSRHTSTPVLLRACDLDMTADQSEDQVEAMFSRCAACDDTSSRKRKRGEGDPRCKKYQKVLHCKYVLLHRVDDKKTLH